MEKIITNEIQESAEKFIRWKIKIKIDRLKEDFITNIKKIELVEQKIKKPGNKFIKVIDFIEVIADITKFEDSVNEFIKPKVDPTVEDEIQKKR